MRTCGCQAPGTEDRGQFSDWPVAVRAAQAQRLIVPLDMRQEDGKSFFTEAYGLHTFAMSPLYEANSPIQSSTFECKFSFLGRTLFTLKAEEFGNQHGHHRDSGMCTV